jgi:hypothetical protein
VRHAFTAVIISSATTTALIASFHISSGGPITATSGTSECDSIMDSQRAPAAQPKSRRYQFVTE